MRRQLTVALPSWETAELYSAKPATRPTRLLFFGNSWGQDTAPSMLHVLISEENSRSRRVGSPHRCFKVVKRSTKISASTWLEEEQRYWGKEVHQSRKSDKGSIILSLLSFCFYRPRRSLKFYPHIFLMGTPVMRQVIDGQGAVHHMGRVYRREWGTHRSHAALTSLASNIERAIVEGQSVGLHDLLWSRRSPVHLLPAHTSSLWARRCFPHCG
jgi:hypothetical protein